jgi:hypothetical protein
VIDVAAIVVEALNDDPEISAELSGGIYAYRIPPEATPPLALVMVPSAQPAAAPTVEWWTYMVTIDIHSEAPVGSLTVADAVTRMVPSIVGTHSTGVVADSQVDVITSITDGAWTPTRYRQIVTVDLTARRTFEGG